MNKRRPPSHAVRNDKRSKDMVRNQQHYNAMINFVREDKHDLHPGLLEFIIGAITAVHDQNKRTIGAVALGINITHEDMGQVCVVKFIDNHHLIRLSGDGVVKPSKMMNVFATVSARYTTEEEKDSYGQLCTIADMGSNLDGAMMIPGYLGQWQPTLMVPTSPFNQVLETFSRHYLSQDSNNPFRMAYSGYSGKTSCNLTVNDGTSLIRMEFNGELVASKQAEFSTRWLLRKLT